MTLLVPSSLLPQVGDSKDSNRFVLVIDCLFAVDIICIVHDLERALYDSDVSVLVDPASLNVVGVMSRHGCAGVGYLVLRYPRAG